jgi:hypothetical protein
MHGPMNVKWLYNYALFKGFAICLMSDDLLWFFSFNGENAEGQKIVLMECFPL